MRFLIYRIYLRGLRLTGKCRKPFAWQQVWHQVGERLPPASMLELRAVVLESLGCSWKAVLGLRLEGIYLIFPLAFK